MAGLTPPAPQPAGFTPPPAEAPTRTGHTPPPSLRMRLDMFCWHQPGLGEREFQGGRTWSGCMPTTTEHPPTIRLASARSTTEFEPCLFQGV